MKDVYILIAAEAVITIRTPVYRLMVGTSEREQQYYKYVQSLAAAHNWYFQVRSVSVNLFLYKIAVSLNVNDAQLNWQYMNIGEFVKRWKAEKGLPIDNLLTPARAQLLDMARRGDLPMHHIQALFDEEKQKQDVIRKACACHGNKPNSMDYTLN